MIRRGRMRETTASWGAGLRQPPRAEPPATCPDVRCGGLWTGTGPRPGRTAAQGVPARRLPHSASSTGWSKGMGRTTLPGAVEGHVHAFRVLCGLPRGRIRYDNLRTAVERMLGLSSRAREEHAGGRPSARTGASTPSPAAPASRERTRRAGRLCGSPTRRRRPSSPKPADRPPRGRRSRQRPALTFSLWADKLCGISPETACRAGPGSPGGLPDGVQCVSPCASFRVRVAPVVWLGGRLTDAQRWLGPPVSPCRR